MYNVGATKDWTNLREEGGSIGRKITYDKEVEDKILQWFLEKRDLQLAVSTEI